MRHGLLTAIVVLTPGTCESFAQSPAPTTLPAFQRFDSPSSNTDSCGVSESAIIPSASYSEGCERRFSIWGGADYLM